MKTLQRNSQLRSWLDSIRGNRQKVTPVDVVNAAKDPDSIGHKHFDWDDTSAGHKYRLMQARQLIRTVYVLDATENKSPAYVSLKYDREHEGGGYRPTQQVLSSKELRAKLVETAKAELKSWTERHAMLTALVSKVAAAAGIAPPKRRKPK